MTEQLKPCPFCGNTDLKSGGDDKIVGVWCENCQMTGPNHYGVFDWNTRPSATPGNTDPMLIARYDDELRKVQGRVQPDWEGFGRAITEDWPTSDIDGSDLFDMSLKYGLIAEIPGGYNPDEHIDSEGICPERGDPWYEYTFRSAPTEHPTEQPVSFDFRKFEREEATEQPSVEEAARVLLANTPNPIFDDLKGVMMGEFYWTREISDENGDEATEKLYVPWTTIKEIILAALRSLAQEGE